MITFFKIFYIKIFSFWFRRSCINTFKIPILPNRDSNAFVFIFSYIKKTKGILYCLIIHIFMLAHPLYKIVSIPGDILFQHRYFNIFFLRACFFLRQWLWRSKSLFKIVIKSLLSLFFYF